MIHELDQVEILVDIPVHGLKAGDVGTVMLVHQNGKGYTLEFLTWDGETVGIVTLDADKIRGIRSKEIPRTRKLDLPLAAYVHLVSIGLRSSASPFSATRLTGTINGMAALEFPERSFFMSVDILAAVFG